MKIKKIIINSETGNQELALSTDENKKFNFVVGENGSGKTVMFNKIKSFFSENRQSEIIFDGEDTIQNPDLMLLDVEEAHHFEYIFKNRTFSDEQLESILQKVEKITLTFGWKSILDSSTHPSIFEKKDGKIILAYNTMAASESLLMFFAFLVVIREEIEPGLPLVLDGLFFRMSFEKRYLLLDLLLEHVPQLLIFFSDAEFLATEGIETSNTFDYLKNKNAIGNIFTLHNHILKQNE